jgi:membrane-bound lytic murein transglycosylase A
MTAARRFGALAGALLLAACVAPERPAEPRLDLAPATFADLPGWTEDDQGEALAAFRASCARLRLKDPSAAVARGGAGGTVADWLSACEAAEATAPGDARAFFETWFTPFAASDRGEAVGFFTGYYEPMLDGSRRPSGRYGVPLYGLPSDLVTVDLGAFAADLEGRSIAGRVADGRLVPYPERSAIVAGALDGKGSVLAWVDDPIGAFFLQIQGSGIVRLEDGTFLRVGYAGSNGRAYVAIGKPLIERGAIAKEAMSMQAIRAWLEANPAEAEAVMNLNPSYVFFRAIDGPGPIGAQGAPLTPGRSLAVDRAFVPLGAPLWLDILVPGAGEGSPDEPMRRLVIAQDTGGAIKGPLRGDLFWGSGAEAGERAGRMKHPGRCWLLLPRTLAVAAAP